MPIVTTQPESVGATAKSWQQQMKDAIRDPEELLRVVEVSPSEIDLVQQASTEFAVFAPRPFVEKIPKGCPDDPLLRQILPVAEETWTYPGFTMDPVGDQRSQIEPGILKKYHRRALFIANGVCAINCRYCFRRHYPYSESRISDWDHAIDTLTSNPSIDEVILSGGDPLTLVDEQLEYLIERFNQVKHLCRLRIHTRLPIVIPQRVTDRLLELLRKSRLAPFFVVQTNHASELDVSVLDSLQRIIAAGVPVLSQTVLLNGVNDDSRTLETLFLRLVNHRVLPYYLHQLDRVAGAGHFDVDLEKGRTIMNELRDALPGYAVPRYVQEIIGRTSKTPIELKAE